MAIFSVGPAGGGEEEESGPTLYKKLTSLVDQSTATSLS